MKSIAILPLAVSGLASFALVGAAAAQPTWSGVYAGLNGGWNSWSNHVDPSQVTVNQLSGVNAGAGPVTVPPTTFSTFGVDNKGSSGTWGGQLGVNAQSGALVFGVEGDLNALYGARSQTSAFTLPATGLTTGSATTVTNYTDPHWMGSVRGRLGWAMGPLLLYGTGGVAFAGVREATGYGYAPAVTPAVTTANPGTTFGPYANGSSGDRTLTGWTVGGGAEWALSRHVSIGAEYRHSDFGHRTFVSGGGGPNQLSGASRMGFSDDEILAKVNYRFGGGLF
ncbi:MAG TPA: outer membrane beta-barrel protein [Caulobacteraceae bacterium]|nr:outer membrane beta-barrel protein [Caulobacteraceae bacterium]